MFEYAASKSWPFYSRLNVWNDNMSFDKTQSYTFINVFQPII